MKHLGRNTSDPKPNTHALSQHVRRSFRSITTIELDQFILKTSSVYSHHQHAAGIIALHCN